VTTTPQRVYALNRAADALERESWLLADLIADDGEYAALPNAGEVIDVLREIARAVK
jgi:hypothetical protein